jgi:hypothetical protein
MDHDVRRMRRLRCARWKAGTIAASAVPSSGNEPEVFMPQRRLLVALALLSTLAACKVDLSMPGGARVACTDASECPQGLICHAGLCQSAAGLDTVPPDLAQPPAITVTPATAAGSHALGRADSEFTITLAVTETLANAPEVTLQLTPVAVVPCTLAAALTYECRYTATGEENAGLGGVVAFDVALVDRAGNQTTKRFAGSIELDFHAPAVAAAGVFYVAGPTSPLALVSRATVGTTISVVVIPDEDLDVSLAPELSAASGGTTIDFTLDAAKLGPGSATFTAVVPAGAVSGTYVASFTSRDLAGNQGATTFVDPPIVVKVEPPALVVGQQLVRYVRSPWGDATGETLGAFGVPAGPYFALAPDEPLSAATTIDAAAFTLTGESITMVRFWADSAGVSLLGSMTPRAGGAWPRARLANLDAPSLYVTGVDDAGNESAPPVKVARGEWVATPNPQSFGTSPHILQATSSAIAALEQETPVTRLGGPEPRGADGQSALAPAEVLWRRRLSNTIAPPPRSTPAMAYDSLRGKLVVFGGIVVSGNYYWLDDLWEWDSTTGLWDGPILPDVRPVVSDAAPLSRSDVVMAYDSQRGKLVLYRGRLEEIWEWDGVARTWAGPLKWDVGPGPREDTAMVFDPVRGRTVLFGGYHYLGFRQSVIESDLWEWDGHAWSGPINPDTRPAGRMNAGIAYDSGRSRLVVFGGSINDTASGDDIWEWDSIAQSWTGPLQPAVRPGPRWTVRLAYDSDRERVILTGGKDTTNFDDLWEWDGASQTWTGPLAPDLRPTPRDGVVLAYDTVGAQTLVFGGAADAFNATSATNELWRWDGSRWQGPTVVASEADARFEHALTYDPVRHRVVLFAGKDGGGFFKDDIREWDPGAGAWGASLTPSPRPVMRSGHTLVYDAFRQRAVVFGGYGGTYADPLDDVWEWDGAAQTWSGPLQPASRPAARRAHAAVWDDVRHKMIVFGGTGSAIYDDVWEWDGDAGT